MYNVTVKDYETILRDTVRSIKREVALVKSGADVSQHAIAEYAGIGHGTLSKLLSGETRFPRFATIYRLAYALGLDLTLLKSYKRKTRVA